MTVSRLQWWVNETAQPHLDLLIISYLTNLEVIVSVVTGNNRIFSKLLQKEAGPIITGHAPCSLNLKMDKD